MKIIHIEDTKEVLKTKKELEQEQNKDDPFYRCEYKTVSLKEPLYIVEMSAKELQLVNFYLELERRKPILNVEIEAELKKEN